MRPREDARGSGSVNDEGMLATAPTPARRVRVPAWLQDALIALLVISSAFVPFDVPGRGGFSLAAVGLLVFSSATLPVRRRLPITALVAGVVVFGAASVVGVVTPAFVIAPAVSLYRVALDHRRLVTLWVTVGTAIALPLVSLLATPPATFEPALFVSAQAIQLAAIVAFAGAIGDATKSRRATLLALQERAERAEETRDSEARRRVAEDRLAIARDLHDLIAHQIAVINLHANVASRDVPPESVEAITSLAVIRDASRTVLAEIGDLLSALRDSPDSKPATPDAGLAQLDALVAQFRSSGLAVEVHRNGPPVALSGFADVVAYKVLQEALTNALKYSVDRACTLRLDIADDLRISVANARAAERGDETSIVGHGITGMRERVSIVGGTLTVEAPQERFTLTVRIPLDPGDPA